MMQENNTTLGHLERIQEMNRLFLSFLQHRARCGAGCLGLPASVVRLLRQAGDADLDRAAALPAALFRLEPEPAAAADAPLEHANADAVSLYCLQASLLQSVRDLCRDSSHLAQAFLSLPARTLIRLRCLSLVEITRLAHNDRLIEASYAAEPWIWEDLLDSGTPTDQRRLRLLALQPRAGDIALELQGAASQRR
jgi:hypothetical protein